MWRHHLPASVAFCDVETTGLGNHEEPAHRVLLPASNLHDLCDGCTLRLGQQGDYGGLLGTGSFHSVGSWWERPSAASCRPVLPCAWGGSWSLRWCQRLERRHCRNPRGGRMALAGEDSPQVF
jgi:hypothetical protein